MNWKKTVFLGLILGIWLGYLGLIGSVNAINYEITCENGRLIKNGTLTVNDDDYTFFQNTSCPYGCSSTELTCKPTPFNQNLFFIGIILFFVIAMAVILHLKR